MTMHEVKLITAIGHRNVNSKYDGGQQMAMFESIVGIRNSGGY